jgi:hypothetical protein
MLTRQNADLDHVLSLAGAIEFVPQSYCEHIIGSSKVWAARVTPELASALLEHNTRNRKMMGPHAASLSRVIEDENWIFNGATIRFDSNGILLDGQHRLNGCVISGEAFDTLIVTGLPTEAFCTIDTMQRTRTTGQVLQINGESNAVRLASAIRNLSVFCNNGGTVYTGSGGLSLAICPAKSEEILRKNEGLRDSVEVVGTIAMYRTGVSAMLHYLFGVSDKGLADDFAVVMREGDHRTKRPFNLFRESFIRAKYSGRPCVRSQAARAIKAFNAELSGRRIESLSYRKNEEFPEIAGIDYSKLSEMV